MKKITVFCILVFAAALYSGCKKADVSAVSVLTDNFSDVQEYAGNEGNVVKLLANEAAVVCRNWRACFSKHSGRANIGKAMGSGNCLTAKTGGLCCKKI